MPLDSLRAAINDLRISEAGANTSLWLDRMVPKQLYEGERPPDGEPHPHTVLIKQACNIKVPKEYSIYFTRWKEALSLQKVICREAEARGRMIVGLGAENVLENSIALQRTYGVPYIPGSAIKGLTAAYAHRFLADQTWHKAVYKRGELVTPIGDGHKTMFGDTTNAGYVTFFDALYVPGTGKGLSVDPLALDVITVHHPKYYQGQEDEVGNLAPPADWDSPTPISFVTATGTYLIALGGPSAWVNMAFDILALALDELGVGAKTSSGYGRLTLKGLDEARQRLKRVPADLQREQQVESRAPAMQTVDPLQQALHRFVQQVDRSKGNDLPNLINQWRVIDPSIKEEAARRMIEQADRVVKRPAEKSWYAELQAFLTQPEG